MVEEPLRDVERTQNVDILRKRLKEFASSDTKAREMVLKELSDLIGNTVTDHYVAELLVTNAKTQAKLRRASELAFETPFEIDGNEQKAWNSGYATAVLSEGGEVLGLLYKPTPSLSEYGYLGTYALRKALFELHLDKAGKKGGLSNVENFDYIVSLGLVAEEDLFTGSTAGSVDFGYGPTYIGGSGCETTIEYRQEVLNVEQPRAETQAGLFDRMFCDITSMYLKDLGRAPTSIPEPSLARERRIHN